MRENRASGCGVMEDVLSCAMHQRWTMSFSRSVSRGRASSDDDVVCVVCYDDEMMMMTGVMMMMMMMMMMTI